METNAAFSLIPLQLSAVLCFFTHAKLKVKRKMSILSLAFKKTNKRQFKLYIPAWVFHATWTPVLCFLSTTGFTSERKKKIFIFIKVVHLCWKRTDAFVLKRQVFFTFNQAWVIILRNDHWSLKAGKGNMDASAKQVVSKHFHRVSHRSIQGQIFLETKGSEESTPSS